MLFRGKRALSHLAAVAVYRLGSHMPDIGIPLHEFRCEVAEQTQHIVGDEHLAVAIGTRADADGGDIDLARHARPQGRRYAFEHEGERTALLHGHRVAQHLIRPLIGFPLHLEAAERLWTLWGVRPT